MARRLADSVVVVTGASSGIGRATALEFARAGASVVLAARNEEALREVQQECEQLGGTALAVPTDTADPESVERLAQQAVERFGRIDTWVNNAAVTMYGRFEEVPPDEFRRVLETNFFGYVSGARAALPRMREHGGGVLINVSSVLGRIGAPYLTAYVASKHAIYGFSESLRLENKGHNVHVCTILPATIDTPIFQHAANYTGRALKALNPVYDASRVVDAIVKCARKPVPQVSVGIGGHGLRLPHALSMRTFDPMMKKHVETDHFQNAAAPPTSGNVREPMREWAEVSGGWEQTGERPMSPLAIIGLAAPAVLAVIGWWLLRPSRRRDRHERLITIGPAIGPTAQAAERTAAAARRIAEEAERAAEYAGRTASMAHRPVAVVGRGRERHGEDLTFRADRYPWRDEHHRGDGRVSERVSGWVSAATKALSGASR